VGQAGWAQGKLPWNCHNIDVCAGKQSAMAGDASVCKHVLSSFTHTH
jgi:hypothetical protein